VQLLPTISYGDAVGNNAIAIKELFSSLSYETDIYAEIIDQRLPASHNIKNAYLLPDLNSEDVLIYHLSVGSILAKKLQRFKCRKIAIYHNVTPKEYFINYNRILMYNCKRGLEDVKTLRGTFDYCIADSSFNRSDLVSYGYKCPIDVCPILLPFNDYANTPNEDVIKGCKDGKVNILFVGRMVPNKKFEDIIAAFSSYIKQYNSNAKLILVGDYEGTESYQKRIQDYSWLLGISENIIFTGKVSFDEILAYYRVADIFICMSEHEGFCVPLVEAMYFDVPIIAYAAAAVPETLAESGILLEEKDPLLTAGLIDRLMTDMQLRKYIIEGQRERLKDFAYEKVSDKLMKYLTSFIEGSK